MAIGAVHQVLLGEVVLHVPGGRPHTGVDGGDGGWVERNKFQVKDIKLAMISKGF